MKKYNITIWGYGAEVTIGSLSNEQVHLIKSKISEDYTLQDVILDEELGVGFYELDDIYHNWGVGDKFNVSITDERGEVVYEFTDELLYTECEYLSM